MMVARTRGKLDHPGSAGSDLLGSLCIGELHDRVAVGHVEVIADQSHPERRVEAGQEDRALLRDTIAVRVPQSRDSVCARHAPAGLFLELFEEKPFDSRAVLRARRSVGLGHQDVAVRQDVDPPGMVESLGESYDGGPWGGHRRGPFRPTFGGDDVDGWDQRLAGRRDRRIRPDARGDRQFRGGSASDREPEDRPDDQEEDGE